MSFLSDIFDFVLPRRCHLCGAPLLPGTKGGESGEKFICSGCISTLPRTNYHRCPGNQMEMRFAGLFPFERATGHFFYAHDSGLASLIHDFKYRGFPQLALHLGKIVGRELLTTPFLSDIDLLLPIPMHFFKQARRGYNQARYLAKGISAGSGIPVGDQLKSGRPHRSQTAFTLEGRLNNMKDVFTIRDVESLRGRHILLVDDVCTTGATLASASRTLQEADPSIRISLLTLAVTT